MEHRRATSVSASISKSAQRAVIIAGGRPLRVLQTSEIEIFDELDFFEIESTRKQRGESSFASLRCEGYPRVTIECVSQRIDTGLAQTLIGAENDFASTAGMGDQSDASNRFHVGRQVLSRRVFSASSRRMSYLRPICKMRRVERTTCQRSRHSRAVCPSPVAGEEGAAQFSLFGLARSVPHQVRAGGRPRPTVVERHAPPK